MHPTQFLLHLLSTLVEEKTLRLQKGNKVSAKVLPKKIKKVVDQDLGFRTQVCTRTCAPSAIASFLSLSQMQWCRGYGWWIERWDSKVLKKASSPFAIEHLWVPYKTKVCESVERKKGLGALTWYDWRSFPWTWAPPPSCGCWKCQFLSLCPRSLGTLPRETPTRELSQVILHDYVVEHERGESTVCLLLHWEILLPLPLL